MKNYTHTNYRVVDPSLSWKSAEEFETLKDAVEDGKAMNKREIEKTKEIRRETRI